MTNYLADLAMPVLQKYMETSGLQMDVMYAYWFYVTTSVASELKRRMPGLSSTPIVSRGHGYDVNEAASPVNYLPFRRGLLSAVERLHPTAETITERMRNQWPEYAEKISTRRLGVRPAGMSIRTNDGPVRVLSVSSMSPVKRVPLMAEAVAELAARGVPVHWTHVGAGSLKEQEALKETIRGLGIEKYVTLAGQMPNDEVYKVLRSGQHTIFLNVSSSESVSFSMSEALGSGLPVVATDVVGTHEIIEDCVNGLLLGSDPSAREVADALLWVHRLPRPEYDRMQQEAYRSCVAHFDPTNVYTAFSEDLYDVAKRQ